MDIYINERSFTGQAQPHTLTDLLTAFAETLGVLRQIGPDADIVFHTSLINRPLSASHSLGDWLFDQRYRDEDEEELDEQETPIQALAGVIQQALQRGPWIDSELDATDYACACGEDAVEGSTVDGAALRGGALLSLGGCTHYPDGPLSVRYMRGDGAEEQRDVMHFVHAATARKCRRRYVPNPKHHPDKAKGDHSPMELDRAYDRFTPEREQELRDQTCDPWDTQVQQLLDRASPGGKQLYARVWDVAGRRHIYYAFQPDSPNREMCCFHGYLVPQREVPAEIVRSMTEADARRDAA